MSLVPKKGNLSLVRENDTSAASEGGRADFAPLDPSPSFSSYTSLDPALKSNLVEFITHLPFKGIITGYRRGLEEWDVRLLILITDRLYTLRFFPPHVSNDPSLVDIITYNLTSIGPIIQGMRWGKSPFIGDARLSLWVVRPYYSQTLNSISSFDEKRAITFIINLIDTVKQLHESGLVHGHIAPENVFFEHGHIRLVDNLFAQSHSSHSAQILYKASPRAPESSGVRHLLKEIDLFGLGQIIKLIADRCPSLQNKLLEIGDMLTLINPYARISLVQVRQVIEERALYGADVLPVSRGLVLSKPLRPDYALSNRDSANRDSEEEQVSKPREKGPAHSFLMLLISILCALLGYIAWRHFSDEKEKISSYAYWESSQIDLMSQVARAAALQDDDASQKVIFDSLNTHPSLPLVKGDILKRCLDPRWSESIDEQSKAFVYRLALSSFLSPEERTLKIPEKLHPGVIVGLLSAASLEKEGSSLRAFTLESLFPLPGPFGKAYFSLSQGEFWSVENKRVVALSHMLMGDNSTVVLSTLLAGLKEQEKLPTVSTLLPFILSANGNQTRFSETLLEHLLPLIPEIPGALHWFSAPSPVRWTTLSIPLLLEVISASRSLALPSDEYYIDLLNFPIPSVRDRALEYLQGKGEYAPFSELLFLVKDKPEILSREHLITLVGALRANPPANKELLSQWLASRPSEQGLLHILSRLEPSVAMTPFLIRGAQHLISYSQAHKGWAKKDGDVIESLIQSRESLVRALGYLLISPSLPRYKEILSQALKTEDEPRLHQQVVDLMSRLP